MLAGKERLVMTAIGDWIGKARGFFPFVLVLLVAACGGGSNDAAPGDGGGLPNGEIALRLEPVGANLGLSVPLFATAPPGDTARLFVVEKGGAIKIIDLGTQQIRSTPFLTVTQISTAGEGGLLGLAFHPDYEFNGFFYVNVINVSGATEIRRYRVLGDPLTSNVADSSSAFLIISIDQPAGLTNHKAGWLGFGQDRFLYAALGDGGGAGDPGENAQNLNSLLGKILRIDVNNDDFSDPNVNYAIPSSNPFAGANPGRDEIWSYGLRNPFRNSFDRLTGDFYIADVGQDRREEVNVATAGSGAGAGVNFGWDDMEGNLCFEPMLNCATADRVRPVIEYAHNGNACSGSVTGGYVYRGTAIPGLQGTYFYADFCQGFVRSFRFAGGAATEQFEWVALRPPGGSITSFGEDAAGELYIMTAGGGLFRIVQ